MMRPFEIHERVDWPTVLGQLGVAREYLLNRHGPCPICGGKDRYRFDNKNGRGSYYCNGCGAGDGFKLLTKVHGWDFRTAIERVMEAAGLYGSKPSDVARLPTASRRRELSTIAQPPSRVRRLRAELCKLEDCDDAIRYLDSRALWPIVVQSRLRAHVGVDYFDNGQKAGRYAALIADVRDFDGALVTTHVTYLHNGRKLAGHEPRKILSGMAGRQSCAVRLYALSGDSMGIGEGLETAIAASVLHDDVPVWSALNTSLLAKFTPPATIKRLLVFADRDEAGLTAACRLLERLQGKVHVEIRTPPAPHKDWNDVLTNERSEP
jgi:putative DNA primase/helicase